MENTATVDNKILLNIQELCDYLGIGQTKARELLKGYNGFGIQIGNRWYANKRKLDAWIDNETMQQSEKIMLLMQMKMKMICWLKKQA